MCTYLTLTNFFHYMYSVCRENAFIFKVDGEWLLDKGYLLEIHNICFFLTCLFLLPKEDNDK